MDNEFTFNQSGIREYIKTDARGAVTQRLFIYDNGRSGEGGGGGGSGSISSARVPELLGSRARVPELVSTARVPELLGRPGGRRTRKNKNRK